MVVHVTARGARQEAIFVDRLDYDRWVGLLSRSVRRFRWRCFAYCAMPNHFHLLLRLEEESLSRGMHWLNWTFACRYNARYGLQGHVFDARFHSETVEREAHFLEALRYIALNPVNARLCLEPSDWAWSSFAATAGFKRVPRFLSAHSVRETFSADRERGAREYAAFVRARLPGDRAVA